MIDDYRNNLKMQGLSLEQYLQFTKSSIEDLKKQISLVKDKITDIKQTSIEKMWISDLQELKKCL